MSSSGDLAGGGSDEDVEADKSQRTSESRSVSAAEEELAPEEIDGVIPTLEDELHGEGLSDSSPQADPDVAEVVNGTNGPSTPPVAGSPQLSTSIPDDTPSLNGSNVPSPLRGTPSPRGSASRTVSGAIKPFERRFQPRFSASPTSSRAGSPAFLNPHSRQSSISSQVFSPDGEAYEPTQAPWEVVRWTKLRKISTQAFSEIGKRQLGTPTCLAVSASIVIGTSKGLILIFDYHQSLKGVLGQGTKAVESGAITSLAIAADYSTVAGGHTSGNIFTWEIAKPAKPFLSIPAVTRSDREKEAEGHIADRSVLHLGFLGTRHTALVSADDGGMAFSHLATRGFGAMGRSVKTTRLLGRYPTFKPEEDRLRKPSSVLAFSSLPLGNVEQATDTMGLTALLTPYLLVVVSTTPIAQTQHKASRPKDISPHGALSACLAWFPAVKLKMPVRGKDISETKLVYCWSDVMTVLDVEIGEVDQDDKDQQPSLLFKTRSTWKCEEAIVAVQWLSRSVIGALTISQRLIILEDGELNVMDSVDLIRMHIFHRDFFSRQLHAVVEQNENEADIHGVVADAFYMSFKAYKGRLFIMSVADVSVGTLSNWADRLTALVEHGDDIEAIRLAVAYFRGSTGKVSVGLPEDDNSRHEMVRDRLLELLKASLRYHLSDKEVEDDRVQELTEECFNACLTMTEIDFLLNEVYDYFDEGQETEIFMDTLETAIMDGDVTSLPPTLVKDLVAYYARTHRETQLEELLCRLEAQAFDIDQITRLCKQHYLYDALIHVWNQALADWITPLTDLFALVRQEHLPNGTNNYDHKDRFDAAMKVFPYLAFSLTGRLYPKGEFMDESQAHIVRGDMYKILFAANITTWPSGTGHQIRTVTDYEEEPAFPYLRLLLHFDTPSFMGTMNEAFEDSYLNSNEDMDYEDSPSSHGVGPTMTRQQIISILLDIMSADDFSPSQNIYLDMFIARSLPKYPQFLILSGSALQKIIHRLCQADDDELEDECQLSIEYLLSVYHPAITEDFLSALHRARYYRVLKSIYRAERRHVDLIRTYLEDTEERSEVYRAIQESLQGVSGPIPRKAIEDLVCARARELLSIDLKLGVQLVEQQMPSRLKDFTHSLRESRLQFAFLQEMLETQHDYGADAAPKQLSHDADLNDEYIELMCIHNPQHVAEHVSRLSSGDLHIGKILPIIEANGVVDAAVLLLAKDGLAREALDRLVKHMGSLQKAICSLIESSADSPDVFGFEIAVKELQEDIDKYTRLGIWLCQGQTKISSQNTSLPRLARKLYEDVSENDLDLDEYLWLTLVDLIVQVSRSVASSLNSLPSPPGIDPSISLRSLVQQVFTALLSSTAGPQQTASSDAAAPITNPPSSSPRSGSFLPIFRLFLARASLSSPSLPDLRAVLLDIFSAYAYESDVLHLAAQLLDRDAFVEVELVHGKRQTGWRPRGQACESCKRRAFGPGSGEAVWEAWRDGERERVVRKKRREAERRGGAEDEGAMGKGKGKGKGKGEVSVEEVDDATKEERKALVVVVFACKHVFHRRCLDDLGTEVRTEEGRYRCPLCSEDKSRTTQ